MSHVEADVDFVKSLFIYLLKLSYPFIHFQLS